MVTRILVAYGTRAGSTQEVAEAIAEVLRDAGAEVDEQDVRRIYAVRLFMPDRSSTRAVW